tara:strand:- start:409 stop:639 length:231 start_codon:yes stop_codon:yes gene_type:complete
MSNASPKNTIVIKTPLDIANRYIKGACAYTLALVLFANRKQTNGANKMKSLIESIGCILLGIALISPIYVYAMGWI